MAKVSENHGNSGRGIDNLKKLVYNVNVADNHKEITMTHIIYDNVNTNNLSEEELDYLENYAFDDELVNLKVQTEGQIVAIASMGLWNGRKQGYKLGTHMLSDVLTIGNEDYIQLYYDGFNVRKTAHHHDGTNYILFREFKPGLSDASKENFINKVYSGEKIDNATLNRYTRSLKRYVKSIYGF